MAKTTSKTGANYKLLLWAGAGLGAVALASSVLGGSSGGAKSAGTPKSKTPDALVKDRAYRPDIARMEDPGSFVTDDSWGGGPGKMVFTTRDKMKQATVLPDGTPILLKYPSDAEPAYVYDLKGRWYNNPTPDDAIYTPSMWPGFVDSASWVDSISNTITKYVIPVGLAILTVLQPEIGIPATLAYTAVARLASGKSLSSVVVQGAMDAYANGDISALQPMRDAVNAVEANLPMDQIKALRNQYTADTFQRYFDQGLVIGVSKIAQDAVVQDLYQKYPYYANTPGKPYGGVIKEALDWGASVTRIADVLGGQDGVRAMEAKIAKAAKDQARKK